MFGTGTGLFGGMNQQPQQPAGGALFGGTSAPGGGLFGQQTAAPGGGGLFGGTTATTGGGLFGTTTGGIGAPGGGGLFGTTTTAAPTGTGGLFGTGATGMGGATGGGLFGGGAGGGMATSTLTGGGLGGIGGGGGGLFGTSATGGIGGATTGGLFGSMAPAFPAQTQSTVGSGLFGGTSAGIGATQARPATGGLFGSTSTLGGGIGIGGGMAVGGTTPFGGATTMGPAPMATFGGAPGAVESPGTQNDEFRPEVSKDKFAINSYNYMPKYNAYPLKLLRLTDYQNIKTGRIAPRIQQDMQNYILVCRGQMPESVGGTGAPTMFTSTTPVAGIGSTTGGGGLFGTTATTGGGGLFGGGATMQPATGGGLFGGGGIGGTTAPATGGGLFGGVGATAQPTGGLFGGGATTQPATGGGLFGGGAGMGQQTTGGGLFGGMGGTTGATATPAGGLFGGATTAPGGGGLFGGQTTTATAPAGGGLFGGQTTATGGGGLFGATTGATTGGGGLFGGQTTGAPATGGGLFGGQTATTGTFGAPTGATGGGLFGANPNAQPRPQGVMMPGDQMGYGHHGAGIVMPDSTTPYAIYYVPMNTKDKTQTTTLPDFIARDPNNPLGSIQKTADSDASSLTRSEYIAAMQASRPTRIHQHTNPLVSLEQSQRMFLKPSGVSPYSVGQKFIPRASHGHQYSNLGIIPPSTFQPFSQTKPKTTTIKVSVDIGAGQTVEKEVDPNSLVANLFRRILEEDVAPGSHNHEAYSKGWGLFFREKELSPSNTLAECGIARNGDRIFFKRSTRKSETSQESNEPASLSKIPILTKRGYTTEPSYDQICRMTEDQLKAVPNFTIKNQWARIQFLDTTDIRSLNLDKIISLEKGKAEIYPDDKQRPPKGQGLNKSALITFYNFGLGSKKNLDDFIAKFKTQARSIGATYIGHDRAEDSITIQVEGSDS